MPIIELCGVRKSSWRMECLQPQSLRDASWLTGRARSRNSSAVESCWADKWN
ncbi:MAG: hypothetical protein ACK4RG_03255 [Fimbriimonadales bacterium]